MNTFDLIINKVLTQISKDNENSVETPNQNVNKETTESEKENSFDFKEDDLKLS